MGDVITRFRLETTQFDSKLRDSAKALQNIAHQAQLGGKDFNDFSQRAIETARALGTVQSGANNTKDKLRDLVGSYNDAAKAYNSLSETAKQGEFGKAMAASLNQLQVRIKETKEDLYGLGDAMKGNEGLFGGEGFKGMLQVFGGNMLTKAAGAVANLGSEMYGMVQQGVELAKQGEGIRIAFERLGRGDILDGLREATHGTVTDIELMKAAVKFNDFKLPLDELGTMLAFAQQKAKDTGQSVDYMVDSIVTGLGRKSLMILDNLGLSASEVKDRMAETGDMTKAVGAIIREQMAKAGDYVETAADRAAQANVSLQNKMEELGRKFAPVEEASSQLWTSMKIGILDIIGGPLARLLNGLTEAGRLKNMLNNMNGESGSGNTKVDQQLKKLNVIKKAGGSNYIFNSTLSGMMEDYNRQIMALDKKIKDTKKLSPDQQASKFVRDEVQKMSEQMKALGVMRDQLAAGAKELSKPVDVKIETKGAEQNVESLKVKLIELEAQRKKAIAAGDTDLSKNLAKQINQVKSDIKGLGGSTTVKTQKNLPTFKDFWLQMSKNDMKLQDQKAAGDLVKDMPSPYQMMFDEIKKQYLDKKDFDYGKDISKEWKVDSKGNLTNKSENRAQESMARDLNKFTGYAEKTLGGVSNIVGGLSQLGVEIPKGLQDVLGGIQGITSIVTGIASLVAMIEALTTVQTTESTIKSIPVIGWALAGGGIVHAASGYEVPGNYYSGDQVPALLNSGELVLNKAQQNALANELQGNGMQNMRLRTEVSGRNLIVVIENDLKARGKGQLATFKG